MAAFAFDTLKMARRLEASGMDRAVAEVLVDVMVETKTVSHADRIVAKSDDTVMTARVVRYGMAGGMCFGEASRDWTARARRDFTIQLGGMFVMWVCITIIGFSYLLPIR